MTAMELGGIWLTRFAKDAVEVDPIVLYVLSAVSAINLVLVVGLLILGCAVKASTPGSSMNFYICGGSLAIVTCVVLRGLSYEEIGNNHHKDAICQFFPVLLCMGSITFIGGLLVRCGAIYTFYKQEVPQKVHKHEWKPNIWMLVLIIIEAAPVLVWIIYFRLEGNYEQLTTAGKCFTPFFRGEDMSKWFTVAMSAWHGLLILMSAIFVWPAIYYSRRSPSETETNILSVAVYNMLFAATAGAVVYFLYEDANPTEMYAILGGLLQYIVFMTLLLMIIAKIVVGRRLQNADVGK